MKYSEDKENFNSGHVTREDDDFNVIFIHSKLDDVGLTASEFRVYAHLARRANKTEVAWPSIPSIAKTCRLCEDSVKYALVCLEGFKMIVRKRRKGMSDLITLTKQKEWRFDDRRPISYRKAAYHKKKARKKLDVNPPWVVEVDLHGGGSESTLQR